MLSTVRTHTLSTDWRVLIWRYYLIHQVTELKISPKFPHYNNYGVHVVHIGSFRLLGEHPADPIVVHLSRPLPHDPTTQGHHLPTLCEL